MKWAWLLWNDGQPIVESVTCGPGRVCRAEQKPGISTYPASKGGAQAWKRRSFDAPIAQAPRIGGPELSPDFSTRRRKVATPMAFGPWRTGPLYRDGEDHLAHRRTVGGAAQCTR